MHSVFHELQFPQCLEDLLAHASKHTALTIVMFILIDRGAHTDFNRSTRFLKMKFLLKSQKMSLAKVKCGNNHLLQFHKEGDHETVMRYLHFFHIEDKG